jgi:hypothetical protein
VAKQKYMGARVTNQNYNNKVKVKSTLQFWGEGDEYEVSQPNERAYNEGCLTNRMLRRTF